MGDETEVELNPEATPVTPAEPTESGLKSPE
jgi:hypothetical protein